jgi:hypothetical protein
MALKRAVLNLYVYNGSFGVDKPTTPNYIINKEVLQGETNIIFEIAELVSDYINIEFTGDFNNISQSTWVEWSIFKYDENDDLISETPDKGSGLAYEGYGYFEDGINPNFVKDVQVMQSNRVMYVPVGETARAPLYTGVGGATRVEYLLGGQVISADDYTTTTTPITVDSTLYSADNFSGLTCDITELTEVGSSQTTEASSGGSPDKIIVTNNNGTTTTININYLSECKYTPVNLAFVNKFGVVQDVWFFKKRDDGINVSKDTYKSNIITNGANQINYSINQAQSSMFNFESTKNVRLNTGFVIEDWYEIIKQIMLTKYAWIKENGTYYPVMPKINTLQKKTNVTDKLIDYSMEFDYAFDTINNIR